MERSRLINFLIKTLALERIFSVLIKLQTSLMLSFMFELFIEISFRYLSLSYGVFCKVGVFASLSEKSERLEFNEKNENDKKWERMELADLGRVAFLYESQLVVF